MTKGPRIGVLFGTRPEAIKLAPVILELKARGVPTTVVTTGQHREMIPQVTRLFGIAPDHDLRLMRHGASLDHILGQALTGVSDLLHRLKPSALVIQGDTTSTLAAALAAFHARVPVAHVEAGLRSGSMELPFPEEMNRRVVSVVARWHFAPTEGAAENLRSEGVTDNVEVTGNTVVDAVQHILAHSSPADASITAPSPYILATAHRRESWGEPIRRIAAALAEVLDRRPDLSLVFATHPNPAARQPVNEVLGGRPRVQLVGAADYATFLNLLQGAAVAVSDSGGIQEEGPTLGIPVLVTREVTERPEGVDAGAVVLVGTDRERIVEEALHVLDDPAVRKEMANRGRSVYGDGHAAERIVDRLLQDVGRPSSPGRVVRA